ncbi:MAG: TonB-dependent receptor [Acidobacteria bacterium]|nr:TonB-dependent receptor [Acidobacteriota bacterium]
MKLIEFLKRHPVMSFLLFCLIPASGFGQVITGDVLGTVTDPSGAVVVHADVALDNTGTGEHRTIQTDAQGNFIFTALQPGEYTVTVQAAGFQPFRVQTLHVGAGARVREIAHLAVAGADTVDVTSHDTDTLKTDESDVTTIISQHEVEQLPLNGRNFIQLAQLSVGVNEATEGALGGGQRPDDRRQTSSISANAQSDTLNQMLIDGMDNNEGSVGTIGVRPSIDSIAQLNVVTSNYPAEIGKTAGAVVNVLTRAGTNQFHGSAFEFFRNDALDARNFFARNGRKPELRQNQYGASLGGPIFRDRTFFFASYEGYRSINSSTYLNVVPTAYEQAHPGDFTDQGGPLLSSPNPVALKFFALYSLPNTGTNTFTYSPRNTQNSNVYDARVDHRWSEHDQSFVRYAHNQVNTFYSGTMPAVNGIEPSGGGANFPGTSFQRAQQIMINHLHTFSPHTLLELKAGYTHLLNRTLPLTYGQPIGNQFGIPNSNYDAYSSEMPYMNITGFASFGVDALPLFNGTNTFQYSASLFHTAGRHSLKAGVIFLRRQIFNQQNAAANTAGSFAFNGQYALNAYPSTPSSIRPLVDFLAGKPYSVRRVVQLYGRYTREFEPSAFIQDDWRVTHSLTLNLGLRWDMWTPLKEKDGHISMFNTDTNTIAVANVNSSDTLGVHTDYTSFAPRLGMSWNVHPTTVIHAAAGATYFRDVNGPQVPFATPPYTFVYSFMYSPAPTAPTFTLGDALPLPVQQSTIDLRGSVRGIDPNFKNAMADQFHADVQQQIGNSVLTIGYEGMRVRRLKIAPDINLAAPSTLSPAGRRPFQLNGLYPNLNASINIFRSQGMSNYNALQTTWMHREAHGLTAQVNYTWAHAMSDTQAFSQSVLFSTVDNSRFHQLEYSNSDLDQRHRFTLLMTYSIPISRNIGGLPRKVLHGWQLNAIDVWGTGFPFTVTNSTARTNTGAFSDRPNQSRDANIANPNIDRWFDTSVFTPQDFGTVGSARRASVYGPHYRHFDLALARTFALHDNVKLQFRAESFNLTNTPNFGQPNGTLGTSTFGKVTATRLGSTPRQMQFAARLSF